MVIDTQSPMLAKVHTINSRILNRKILSLTYKRMESSFVKARSMPRSLNLAISKSESSTGTARLFQSKYADVWKRARLKIKAKCILERLLTSRIASDHSNFNFVINKKSSYFAVKSKLSTDYLPCYLINPKSKKFAFWNIFIQLVLIYSITITPVTNSFTKDSDWIVWDTLDLLADVFLFLDFLIIPLIPKRDGKNRLVISIKAILKLYPKSNLLIDTASFFPFPILMFYLSPEISTFASPAIYQFLAACRIIKTIRHTKKTNLFDRIQKHYFVKSSTMRLLKYLLILFICLHNSACFWHFSAKLQDSNPDTWVNRLSFQNESLPSRYLISLYWAFTTLCTVGYGDISPLTNIEKFVAICWMSLGMYFFAFIIGSLSSMLSSIDSCLDVLENKLEIVREMSRELDFTPEFKRKLEFALKYSTKYRGFSWICKIGMIQELPKHLRYEIAIKMHHGSAKHIQLFKNQDKSLISFVVPMLQPMFVQRDDLVYCAGDHAGEVYFVVKGRIGFFYTFAFTFKSFDRGDCFGDIEVIKGVRRKYSALAIRDSHLLIMNRAIFEEIKIRFPDFWRDFCENAFKKEENIELNIVELQELSNLNNNEGLKEVGFNRFRQKVAKIFEVKNRKIKEEYNYDIRDLSLRIDIISDIINAKKGNV